MKTSLKELNQFWDRKASIFAEAFSNLAYARLTGGDYKLALYDLQECLRHTMILSNLHGRRRTLLEADYVKRRAKFDAEVEENTPLSYLTFEEAVEDLVKREPRLENSSYELSRLYNTERVFGMAYSIDQKLTERVQATLAKFMKEGMSFQSAEKVLEEITPFTRSYAANVYRTNLNTNYTAGRFEQARDPIVEEVIPAMEFVSVKDARTRHNHAAADGLIAATNDPIWGKYAPPLGYQCFVPDTVIEGDVVGGLKAFYSGTVVEIKTSNLKTLTVTVGHPVLTSRGWVPADSLREGDDCFSYIYDRDFLDKSAGDRSPGFPPFTGRAVDNQNVPSRIEDVFEALWVHRATTSFTNVPVLPLDLHGDATSCDPYIDVVRADSDFPLDPSQLDSKGAKDFIDMVSPRGTASSLNRLGVVGSSGECSFTSKSSTPSASTLTLGENVVVAPSLVLSPLESFRFGSASNLDVPASEEARYSGSADPEFVAKLLEASAGLIRADKIVGIRRIPYRGHVYDLQTKTGWILSNGIVTSNCRCSAEFVSVFDLERKGLIRDGKVVRYLPPTFGKAHADENFKVGAPSWEVA